jgi:hypothetical protein
MHIHEFAKQRKLYDIEARLARHEKAIYLTLLIVVILAGLAIAWFMQHLFGHSK